MSDTPSLPPLVPLVQPHWSIRDLAKIARRNLLELIPVQTLNHPIVSGSKGTRWHMITEPAALKRVLLDNQENYPKAEVTKSISRPAIGESVFIAEGAHWRWQRRAVAPAFSRRNIANFSQTMEAAANRASVRLEAKTGGQANLLDEMIKTTFEVISDVTLSGDEHHNSDQVQSAFEAYISRTASASLLDIFGLPAWVPRPGRVFGARHIRYMTAMADGAISLRRDGAACDPPDLLDLLMAGEDPETKRMMTAQEIRNNLLTFIFAGHETTALTLAWALYLCGFDPEAQARARTESKAALQGRVATQADLSNLTFTRQIIEEALRLYPPFALIARTAQQPDNLADTEIRKGDTVVVPIYSLHRSVLYWDQPDAFVPERFAPGHSIQRFQYLPFGDGPRVCIGMSFALQEAVIILATLLSRFEFSLVSGQVPTPKLILTLRPDGGVWLKVDTA